MSTATHARPSAARQRILDTAFVLFYARGIRAVGIDLIIAESGVAKATFYKHFPAKDDLVVAYLDKVDAIWTGQLKAAAEAAGPDPRTSSSACSTHCRAPAAGRATGAAPSSMPRPSRSPARRSTTARSGTRRRSSRGCATWPGPLVPATRTRSGAR